jgi:hypothetical protein
LAKMQDNGGPSAQEPLASGDPLPGNDRCREGTAVVEVIAAVAQSGECEDPTYKLWSSRHTGHGCQFITMWASKA